MTNKYQEALNYICSFISSVRGRGNGKSNLFIKLVESSLSLQELIDKQNEYIYQMDKYEMQYKEMFEKMAKLEKVLDKACNVIFHARVFDGKTPNNIKEYLLKESEKQ